MYIVNDATKSLRLKVALKKIILTFHKLLKQNLFKLVHFWGICQLHHIYNIRTRCGIGEYHRFNIPGSQSGFYGHCKKVDELTPYG